MYEGWNVPIEYDPLLAKLIGYGEDREQAINRLLRALYEYFVGGIKTNIVAVSPHPQGPGFPGGQSRHRLSGSPADQAQQRDRSAAPDYGCHWRGDFRQHGTEGDVAGSKRRHRDERQ